MAEPKEDKSESKEKEKTKINYEDVLKRMKDESKANKADQETTEKREDMPKDKDLQELIRRAVAARMRETVEAVIEDAIPKDAEKMTPEELTKAFAHNLEEQAVEKKRSIRAEYISQTGSPVVLIVVPAFMLTPEQLLANDGFDKAAFFDDKTGKQLSMSQLLEASMMVSLELTRELMRSAFNAIRVGAKVVKTANDIQEPFKNAAKEGVGR